MNWKDVLFGSLVTLGVTVLAGVLIYYLTRESPAPPPAERLVYSIDTPVTFESDQTRLSFTNIRLRNIGDVSAENVIVGVDLPSGVGLIDTQVILSSGPGGRFEFDYAGSADIRIVIPVLTPEESATITLLTDAAVPELPTVGVKSDSSTGFLATVVASQTQFDNKTEVIGVLVLLAFLVQLLLLPLLIPKIRTLIRRAVPPSKSVNNTAFVLLHQGLTDDAVNLLERSIEESGGEPFTLSNYALALGLSGNAQKADAILAAADFWAAENKHAKAVVAFNRSILCFSAAQESEGVKLMKIAISLSKSEIIKYLKYSALVDEQRGRSPELHSLLNEYGLTKDA